MDLTLLSLGVYVAAALIAAAVFMVLRDLFGGGSAKREPSDREKLNLPSVLPADADFLASEESWLTRLTAQTGSDFTAETALMLAILIALILGGGFFLWRNNWLAGVSGAVVGVIGVVALLFYLRRRRQGLIRDQLPDVMELMARAVRAGESLDQAITLAGNSGIKPVDAEFRYCARQMKMGLSLEAAIRRLVARAPLIETRILAMTFVVQRRRGGSLPTTLERLAQVFRDRAAFYRQFRAATALGRGSASLIALVAFGIDAFMILGHSEFAAALLTSNIGRGIFALAVGLQVVGVIWALWLFRSRY